MLAQNFSMINFVNKHLNLDAAPRLSRQGANTLNLTPSYEMDHSECVFVLERKWDCVCVFKGDYFDLCWLFILLKQESPVTPDPF